MERSSTTTLEDFPEASARSTFIGGTVNTIAAASRFLGKKVCFLAANESLAKIKKIDLAIGCTNEDHSSLFK